LLFSFSKSHKSNEVEVAMISLIDLLASHSSKRERFLFEVIDICR